MEGFDSMNTSFQKLMSLFSFPWGVQAMATNALTACWDPATYTEVGIRVDDLGQAIRDAVEVTCELGIRYL